MLFTKARKLAILLSGAAAIALIGGCSSAGTSTSRLSYLDQKGHIHYTPVFANTAEGQPTPYALTGRQAAPTLVKGYDQKGHIYYWRDWPNSAAN